MAKLDYQKHYDLLIERARDRQLEGYSETHHLIPRCMNGTDEQDNLVSLTPEEHFVAHQLLVKMHPNEASLIYAANMMTVSNGNQVRNNKRYGWLKRKYSKVCKQRKGKKNGAFGTFWITDGSENQKLNANEEIPEGWERGRKLKSNNKCVSCSKDTGNRRRKYCDECKPKKNNLIKDGKSVNLKATDNQIKDALNKYNFDIDLSMKSLGYKEKTYGNSRNRFIKIKMLR